MVCVFCFYMMTSSNGNIFRVTGPLCGEFTGHGEFPAQRPVTQSFDDFFDKGLHERLSKQSWGWWFETPSHPLWRHRNDVDCNNSLLRGQSITCHCVHDVMCEGFCAKVSVIRVWIHKGLCAKVSVIRVWIHKYVPWDVCREYSLESGPS